MPSETSRLERAQEGSKGLINSLRRTFITYSIPYELSSDGGPEYIAKSTDDFLKSWGVRHRISSVAFPHSNCRAKVGVKRMIVGNTGPNGELDTNAFQRAMLIYRNTSDPETDFSPAMCIFGQLTRSTIPILPGKYQPHPTWQDTLQKREEAFRIRHFKIAERLLLGTRLIAPLRFREHICIQNQVGPNPRKWDKTGVVIKVKQHNQYMVRVDGSGRVTLHNRKLLRKFVPVITSTNHRGPSPSVYSHLRYLNPIPQQPTQNTTPSIASDQLPQVEPSEQTLRRMPTITTTSSKQTPSTPPIVGSPTGTSVTPVSLPPCDPTPSTPKGPIMIRRSTRQHKTPAYLNDYEH